MDLFKQFKTDEAKTQEGVWVSLDETSRIRIARTGNAKYREAIKAKSQRYRMRAKVKTIPEKDWADLMNEVIAETILVDWEGITEKGVPVSYSVENAARMLADYPDFRDTVVLPFADDMENFKAELDEATEKNSLTP